MDKMLHWRNSWFVPFLKRLNAKRKARWALAWLFLLSMIGLLAPLISNDVPLWCKVNGRWYAPAFRDYGVQLGIVKQNALFVTGSWKDGEVSDQVMPLIPFSHDTRSTGYTSYLPPFTREELAPQPMHWLGTDKLGRDVLAGLIEGSRLVLWLSLFTTMIATGVGLLFGSLAGYYGDSQALIPPGRLAGGVLGLGLGVFWSFVSNSGHWTEGAWPFLVNVLLLTVPIIAGWWLGKGVLERWAWARKPWAVPVDMLVMRAIEIASSVPTLLLVMSLMAVVGTPGIWLLSLVLALVRWDDIARYLRGELLRIRGTFYIQAVQTAGLAPSKIILKYLLPNAMAPVLFIVALTMSWTILLESSFSFLGIATTRDSMSWGRMLAYGREFFPAWWLTLFPGVMIFLCVLSLNVLADAITEALDSKERLQ